MTIHSLLPPTSAITFFQVEDEEKATAGGVIAWEQQIKLRHATNQLYLAVSKSGQVYMSSDPTPETVFRLYPVTRVFQWPNGTNISNLQCRLALPFRTQHTSVFSMC